MKVKGVNLGNWLVLEKWMNPKIFEGTTAEDEYWLPRQLSPEVYEARINTHRNEYITERDFAIIKSWGLEAVRIPIPYFIFGDCEPFIGCIEHLDHAFAWAQKYGLKILIDLHTAPDGQNGSDNGGICGVCKWAQSQEKVDFVLKVLERLAQRYGTHEALWGIEILNEPCLEEMWDMAMKDRYKPADLDMAKGSKGISKAFLREFYIKAYGVLRKHMPEEKYVVFHDAFVLTDWKDFMQEECFKGVVLDTHLYLVMVEYAMDKPELQKYLENIELYFATRLREMQKYFDVIVGEWCLFNSLVVGVDTNGGQTIFVGADAAKEEKYSVEEKKKIYKTLAKAQLDAWENGSGWFYWNYKHLLDTTNEYGWIGWDCWDLGRCIALDWFPMQ